MLTGHLLIPHYFYCAKVNKLITFKYKIMKQLIQKFTPLTDIELKKNYGGEVVRVVYYEDGVRKVKYVEV